MHSTSHLLSLTWCSPVIREIVHLLTYLNAVGSEIEFCWIPGHVGIPGNEMADRTANRAEAPISIIACPHRDRVIINRESYSVTFLTNQSACSLQHRESWLSAVWWSLSVVAECPVHIVVFILYRWPNFIPMLLQKVYFLRTCGMCRIHNETTTVTMYSMVSPIICSNSCHFTLDFVC